MKRTFTIFALALLPLGAWADEAADADFFGDSAPAVTTAVTTSVDPTKQFAESADGLKWGGTVTSSATWNGGWLKDWPSVSDPTANWNNGLDYTLSSKLHLDGRPDKDFRFRLSLQTGYPFTNDTTVLSSAKYVAAQAANALYPAVNPGVTTTSSTLQIPNIKVWEFFTDVTVADTLFLRFGKQSASWGVAYFYSPGDVISLTAKDASDPTAEREGPVALKATLPFPNAKANLTAFVIARDSYFAKELPSLTNLGYALQADVLVGQAQLSLGGFYQKDNAPKAVATVNTGLSFLNLPVLSDINLFSEAVFSYGADVLKGSGTATSLLGTTVYSGVSSWDKTVYYTGTVGASYSNSDANLSLRTEYLYNPFGSSDPDAATRSYNTFIATMAKVYSGNSSGRDYGFGDASTPGIHNLTSLLSLSKVAGSEKLSFSTLWQQNLSDKSGWVKPSFTFQPWDQLGFTWGITAVYGDTGTQFPLQFQAYDKNQNPLGTKRLTVNVGVTFGTGKY
jgi:hypothetical protein